MTESPLSTSALLEFAAVARHLSFVQAARELGLHPSVLSRRIQALEQRLGVRLLQRDTRRVSLTEAGHALLGRTLDILTRLDDARAEVSRYSAEATGTLRLALPNLFGQLQVAPLLPAFMRQHPGLRLDLSFNDRLVDLVEHNIDAAIRIGALEAGGDYQVRRIADNHRVICAAPAYIASHGAPGTPAELAGHRILHFSPLFGGTTWRLKGAGAEVKVALDPVMSSDNVEALRYAALAGEGIALLATFAAWQDLAAGRLVPLLPDYRLPESTISIIYPHAPYLPRKVRAFIDFMVQAFSGGVSWDCAPRQ